MADYVWIVTLELREKKGKQVLDEQGNQKINSTTIGPFSGTDGEAKAQRFVDKNIHLPYKMYKCSERVREKAAKKIKAGEAEEI